MSPPDTSTYKRLWKANISLVCKFQKIINEFRLKISSLFQDKYFICASYWHFWPLDSSCLKRYSFLQKQLKCLYPLPDSALLVDFIFIYQMPALVEEDYTSPPLKKAGLTTCSDHGNMSRVLCVTGRNHKSPFMLHHILFSICIVINDVSCRSCTGRLCPRANRVKAHAQ